MSEPGRERKFRDYFTSHEYPGENANTGPWLFVLLVFAIVGIVAAGVLASYLLSILVALVVAVGIVSWFMFINRRG